MARRPSNRAGNTSRSGSRTARSRTGAIDKKRGSRTSSYDRRDSRSRTSSYDRRDSRGGGSTRSGRDTRNGREGRGRKQQQKSNTPIIIGMVITGFILLIIIIAVATSGGGSKRGSGDNYMTLAQKQSVYKYYIAQCKKIEQEAKDGLSSITDADTLKKSTAGTARKTRVLKEREVTLLQNKWSDKIRGLPSNYIQKNVIDYGRQNGW